MGGTSAGGYLRKPLLLIAKTQVTVYLHSAKRNSPGMAGRKTPVVFPAFLGHSYDIEHLPTIDNSSIVTGWNGGTLPFDAQDASTSA